MTTWPSSVEELQDSTTRATRADMVLFPRCSNKISISTPNTQNTKRSIDAPLVKKIFLCNLPMKDSNLKPKYKSRWRLPWRRTSPRGMRQVWAPQIIRQTVPFCLPFFYTFLWGPRVLRLCPDPRSHLWLESIAGGDRHIFKNDESKNGENGMRRPHCGAQETFRGCADICIGHFCPLEDQETSNTSSEQNTHLRKFLWSKHETFYKCFVLKVTDVVPDSYGSPQGLLTLPSPLTIISCFDNTTFSFCHL